ncbi:shikimate dehydrogenase [Rhizobium sp. TRM95796]|uniref:shikimate dehydrogenase n=1 Tax=Rhizobium sp. TRM95796 TaxID=2979862 RepID=UPI0021E88AB8|nr:shikimate dehydrogenase [Rhizobium sp. TRM95796]MCV3768866.1 shikimate dehydrogenase [Rhizobium sp. TRM95796]
MTRPIRVGLIGSGISASRTPAMHIREGRLNGLNYRYDLIDLAELNVGLDALPRLLDQAERDGFAGVNVTHPCKQAATGFVDSLSKDGAVLGAINTITFVNGRRTGHNTDWSGFARGFQRSLPDARLERVVLVGAGGAGVAVAHALASMGCRELCVLDVDSARSARLVEQLKKHHPNCVFRVGVDMASAIGRADGVVHATPTGMAAHPGVPFDVSLLNGDQWVAEIVYFPLETQLLAEAARLGCRVVNGGGMAVFQAVGAFELFTGIVPDAERMIQHFSSLGEGGGI